jgi:hypothetical protein
MNCSIEAIGGPGLPTETVLFVQAQAGCQESLNRLMVTHENLVHAVVRQQTLGHLPFCEVLHAGHISLWRPIQGYDPQRGLAFFHLRPENPLCIESGVRSSWPIPGLP